jgi:Domain of unknown function (DUF4426)
MIDFSFPLSHRERVVRSTGRGHGVYGANIMIRRNFTLSPGPSPSGRGELLRFGKFIFLGVLFFSITLFAHAQFLKSGDVRIYANAILSSQLNAQMAQQYGITRSASRVLLHVVVREGVPGKDRTLPAKISAVAVRKNGDRSTINMQFTQQNQEVYYLGELNIHGNEAINFEIITEIEKQKPLRMTFFQEFFSQ